MTCASSESFLSQPLCNASRVRANAIDLKRSSNPAVVAPPRPARWRDFYSLAEAKMPIEAWRRHYTPSVCTAASAIDHQSRETASPPYPVSGSAPPWAIGEDVLTENKLVSS